MKLRKVTGYVVQPSRPLDGLLIPALRFALPILANLDLYFHAAPVDGGGYVGTSYGAAAWSPCQAADGASMATNVRNLSPRIGRNTHRIDTLRLTAFILDVVNNAPRQFVGGVVPVLVARHLLQLLDGFGLGVGLLAWLALGLGRLVAEAVKFVPIHRVGVGGCHHCKND